MRGNIDFVGVSVRGEFAIQSTAASNGENFGLYRTLCSLYRSVGCLCRDAFVFVFFTLPLAFLPLLKILYRIEGSAGEGS